MYEATCFVCKKPISWQEIQAEDVVCIGNETAHSDCYYDEMPDNVGGLGVHGPKNAAPISLEEAIFRDRLHGLGESSE